MELVAKLRSDSRFKQSVSLLGGRLRRDEAEPPCDTVNVRVDWKRGAAHREEQHASRRLRTHSGQRDEVALDLLVVELVQPSEVEAALALFDLGQDPLNANRLRVREPARANGIGKFRRIRVPDRVPVGEAILQASEGARGVQIRRVLAQYGHHELVHDGELLLASKRALLAQQPAVKRPRSSSINLWGQRGTFASDANFVY